MSLRRTFSILVTLTIAGSAWGQCLTPILTPAGPVSPGDRASLVFEGVEGAQRYQIEAWDEIQDAWYILGTSTAPAFELPPLALASNQDLLIRVFAANTTSQLQPAPSICFGETTIEVRADPRLRDLFGRVVIPVAGSLEGAYGSQWRTMLSLTNNETNSTLHGRVQFHPAGAIASDHDPFLTYRLLPGEVVQWPDIVAELGATGLGSIDIIPADPRADANRAFGPNVPTIQTRIVNDAGDGTFGTNVREVFVRDLAPAQIRRHLTPNHPLARYSGGTGTSIIVPADYGSSRLNIGFRYFDFADLIRTLPLDPVDTPFVQLGLRRGGQFVESVIREAPAGYIEQVRADQIFSSAIQPGDVIVIRAVASLVYWTITDNETNDPSFFFDVYSGRSKRIYYE